MENLILIVLGLVALVLALCLLYLLIIGAIGLFAWAGEQGFVGLAVYFACWVFLAPVMVVGSIIFGAIDWWSNR